MSLSKSESEAEDENEIFKKNRVGILNYFKGKHILKEIIDGIEEEELLGLD